MLLLNTSLGYLSIEALRTAAVTFASRKQKPCPTFHVTAVEALMSQSAIARSLPRENYKLIFEDFLNPVDSVGRKWKSFGTVDSPPVEQKVEICNEEGTTKTWDSKVWGNKKQGKGISEDVLSKIRTRLSTLTKDPRQLRPSTEDGISRMALARLIQAPMGPNGPQLPLAQSDDYLNDKVDIVVNRMIDTGLLGEGILPILSYCWDALTKSNAKVRKIE